MITPNSTPRLIAASGIPTMRRRSEEERLPNIGWLRKTTPDRRPP
jgi:hypothetical protein